MPDWIVKVTDEGGAAITNAEISLAPESEIDSDTLDAEVIPRVGRSQSALPLMAHQADGTYRLPSPLTNPSGEWRLVVRSERRSTVVQPVVIAASSQGGFATSPRNLDSKGPAVEVATVEIATHHANGDSTTTFKVKQLPASEVVLLSGTQYSAEAQKEPLRTFAEGRRDLLAGASVPADRRIDDGTIVSLWSLDDRTTFFFVKARGSKLAWVLVHQLAKARQPDKPITPGKKWPKKPDASSRGMAIHPKDLYGYLHAIGKSSAMSGRVREVSIFSHAYNDGPILYNTFDTAGGAGRDPKDFDCRTKDWEQPELAAHDDATKAMHSKGRWHIWGCNTNPELVQMSSSANLSRQQKLADDELFMVHHDRGDRRFEARIDRRKVLRFHLEWLTGRDPREYRSYAGMLLGALRCDVFAALPGTWSNFSKANRTMHVDAGPTAWPFIEKYYKEEPALKNVFKPSTGIDGERYANYRDFAAVNFPTVKPRSAQYEFYQFLDPKKFCAIRLHGGQLFKQDGVATLTSMRIPDVGTFDVRFTGKPGHRYAFSETPGTESAVLIAVETGTAVRVFALEKRTTGAFDTVDFEVPPP